MKKILFFILLVPVDSYWVAPYNIDNCFLWGEKFDPPSDMKLQPIEPIIHTDVENPLQLIRDGYHDRSMLHLFCEPSLDGGRKARCEEWRGYLDLYDNFFDYDRRNEAMQKSHDQSSWTYDFMCQRINHEDTWMYCMSYFYFPNIEFSYARSVHDLAGCARKCHNERKLEGFSFIPEQKKCHCHTKPFVEEKKIGENINNEPMKAIINGRSDCYAHNRENKNCYTRGIRYEGDELEPLARLTETQTQANFYYAKRNPDDCQSRCGEYGGACHYFTLDSVSLKCILHGPLVKPKDDIFSYVGSMACLAGLECEEVTYSVTLGQSLDIKCEYSLKAVYWGKGYVDGVEVKDKDPKYYFVEVDPKVQYNRKTRKKTRIKGYFLLRIYSVTQPVLVMITAKMHRDYSVSQQIVVGTHKYDKVPRLRPFDLTRLARYDFDMSRHSGHYSGYHSDSSYATDESVFSCAWTRGVGLNDPAYLSIKFGETMFMDEVVIHLMFYTPGKLAEKVWRDNVHDNCQGSEEAYRACKDSEGPFKIISRDCFNDECSNYFDYECGTITPGHGLTQEDQIYRVTCNSNGEQLIVERDTPGDIRICEIQISNHATDCPPMEYLSYPGHYCIPCPEILDKDHSDHAEVEMCYYDDYDCDYSFKACYPFAELGLPPAESDEISNITLSWDESGIKDGKIVYPGNPFDKLFYTCVSTETWIKLDLGDFYQVFTVTFYTIFLEDWFLLTYEESNCQHGPGYTACRVNEKGSKITLLNEATKVKTCNYEESSYYSFEMTTRETPVETEPATTRYRTPSYSDDYGNNNNKRKRSMMGSMMGGMGGFEMGGFDLELTPMNAVVDDKAQLYRVSCKAAGNAILIEAGNSALRVCEIIVKSSPQNCTSYQYFNSTDNTCHGCPSGERSFGCYDPLCTSDYKKFSSSMWEPYDEGDNEIEYEAVLMDTLSDGDSSSEVNTTYMLSLLSDRDLSTVMELDGVGDWIMLNFEEDWRVDRVKLYFMFYTEWFSCGGHKCLVTELAYRDCKNEAGVHVFAESSNNDTVGCGYLNSLQPGLTQSDQIVTTNCQNHVTRRVKIRAIQLIFRIAEIVVLKGAALPCPKDHFLKEPNNVCYPCGLGYNSKGCWSTSCTTDKKEISDNYWEPYMIGNYTPEAISERLEPVYVTQSTTTNSHGAFNAIDNDLYTYSLASVTNDEVWFKVELEKDKNMFLYAVQVFQEFYSEWFYCQDEGSSDCRGSLRNYQDCKDKGTDIKVDVYSNETLVNSCGTLELTYELNQTSQEYVIVCEHVGNTILLSKTAVGQGWIKIYEIVVYTRAHDCGGGSYGVEETNTCLPCPINTYNPGGYFTWSCTPCPAETAAPSGLASSQQDCSLVYTDVTVSAYSVGNIGAQEGIIGTVTLLRHELGRRVERLLKITWSHDQIQVQNLCNENDIVSHGEDQVMIVTKTDQNVTLFFYSLRSDQNDADSPRSFSVQYSECRERGAQFEMVFTSNITTFATTTVPDCTVIDERWNKSVLADPSQLPAGFMSEVEVGCESGFFNKGDVMLTCIGSSYYLVQNQGPLCKAQPKEDASNSNFTNVDVGSSILDCGSDDDSSTSRALDFDLMTCSGSHENDEGEAWIEFGLNETQYVKTVILYTLFYENWYDATEPCVVSEAAYLLCKEKEEGARVDLYLEEVLVKTCGTIADNEGLTQDDQTFQVNCDEEGDKIKVTNSEVDGVVRIYEIVVSSFDCGEPAVPQNGVLETKNHTHTSFSCNTDYLLFGNSLITCQQSGLWEASPSCLPDCGEVVVPVNGVVESSNLTHTTFACNEGFAVSGSAVVKCLDMGFFKAWDVSPECHSDVCGELEPPKDGFVEMNYVTHATINCYGGYQLVGNSTVACQDSGTWGETPDCLIVCGNAQEPVNGWVSVVNLTHAVVQCSNGLTTLGDSNVICQESGTWEVKAVCVTDCKDVYVPPNAVLESRNVTHAVFSCNEGYFLLGDEVAVCYVSSGIWGASPQCKKDCGDIPLPDHGVVVTNIKTSATLSCDEGWALLGDSNVVCLETGVWEHNATCVVDCGELEPPVNGIVEAVSLVNATLSCDSGFTNISSLELICLDTGDWETSPLCVTDCGDPEDTLRGYLEFNNLTHASFSCNEGHFLKGKKMIECQEEGTWEETPWCAPECGDITGPEHGSITFQNLSLTVMSCDEGYSLTRPSHVPCLESGNWSTPPLCSVDTLFGENAMKFSIHNADDADDLYGKILVTKLSKLRKTLVEIEWFNDKIVLTSYCNEDELVVEGVDLMLITAEVKGELVFYFYSVGDGETGGSGDKRYVQDLVDCMENEFDRGITYVSTTAPVFRLELISAECEVVEDYWAKSVAADLDQLPAQFQGQVEVGCYVGYKNVGDRVVTCLGANFYHVQNNGPVCRADRADLAVGEDEVKITKISVGSVLTECGDSQGVHAIDHDLTTCTGSVSVEGVAWVELEFKEIRYVNNLIVYTSFYDNWYNSEDPCGSNLLAYKSCKDEASSVNVDMYQDEVFVSNCGTLVTNHGTTQDDQIYRISCNAEGNKIKLSKLGNTASIKVYELVVISKDCPELYVKNGAANQSLETNHRASVTCDSTYHYYAQTADLNLLGGSHTDGTARCVNGSWAPYPYCLPTCDTSYLCSFGQSCRMLHALPLCFTGCDEMEAPMNGTVISSNATHTVFECGEGFTLLGKSVVTCHAKSGIWDNNEGPWCVTTTDEGRETLAISRPVFDATRLERWLGRWKFTANCPPGFVVKVCRCLITADFPGNCEGSEISETGTDCYFTNSPANNIQNMKGYAVCIKDAVLSDPCVYQATLPRYLYYKSATSHFPNISCTEPSHPHPASCNVAVRQGDVLLHWNGEDYETNSTSEVNIGFDGVCSLKCFNKGYGTCILSLRCSAFHDKKQYIQTKCPTCAEMICSPADTCVMIDNVPTCAKACDGFLVLHGHVSVTGSEAVVTCEDKYYYSLNTPHTCTPNGRWMPSPGRCLLHDCGSYSCKENEYCKLVAPDPPPYIHSNDPFDTTTNIPQCFKKCAEITVPNAHVENSNEAAFILCKAPKFRLTGSRLLECLPTGVWSDEIPTCDPALCSVKDCQPDQFCVEEDNIASCRRRCGELSVKHGEVQNHNLTAEITCNAGYYLHPSHSIISCRKNGRWSANLPECRLKCAEVERIPTDVGTQEITFSVIRTTCLDNLVLVGSATRECQDNGTWSGEQASCESASCEGVTCPALHQCTVVQGTPSCVQFEQSQVEDLMSSCLQNFEYEDDCDNEIAAAEKLFSPTSVIDSLAKSMLKVEMTGNNLPYLMSKKFLKTITPREADFTEPLMKTVLKIAEQYTQHIETLPSRENREVLVAQTMLIINSNIRAIQHKNREALPVRTKEEAKKAWLDTSRKHRLDPGKKMTKTPAYSSKHSDIMLSLKSLAQRLIQNLKSRRKDEL